MRTHLCIGLLAFHSAAVWASDPPTGAARAAGMAQVSAGLTGLWSLLGNPAGAAALTNASAGLAHQRHWLIPQLAEHSVAVGMPTTLGTVGVAVQSAGFELYRERTLGLVYARAFGDGLRIGLRFHHHHLRLGDVYGSRSMLSVDAGVQARITDQLWIGVQLHNPGRSALGGPYDDRRPTVLRAGLNYSLNKAVDMLLDVEKDMDLPQRYRCGLEYRPNEVLYLRTGVATGPFQGAFGAGVRAGRWQMDLALGLRDRMGPTPMLNLDHAFR